jgi:hypothetical protein
MGFNWILEDKTLSNGPIGSQSKIIVDPKVDKTEINQVFTFVSAFRPISDGGYEQRFVNGDIKF